MLFICIMLPVPWGLEKALRVTIPDRKHSRRLIRARLTGAEFKLSNRDAVHAVHREVQFEV